MLVWKYFLSLCQTRAQIFSAPFSYAMYIYICRRRDSAVSIATGYELDDRGVGVRVPVDSRNFYSPCRPEPITLAELSKTWTVFDHLNAGIVGWNPTRGINVYMYVYVYSMFVLSYVGRGLAMSWSLLQGVLPTVLD
jgi:hypothetical protein